MSLASTASRLQSRGVKIISLLPSATEIVFALGLGDQLSAVTFECDFPPEARDRPAVSGPAITALGERSARDIDDEVRARVSAGEPLYILDSDQIRLIAPDVILAQDLCRVCAVPSGQVEEALEVIGCHAQVVSLDPESLDDVIGCVGLVGRATGALDASHRLMATLRGRVASVRERLVGLPRPRVLVLEWSDPPFNAGHWVPDMVDAAGGSPILATAGTRSRELSWEEIASEAIDVTIFSPCGFDLAGAVVIAEQMMNDPRAAHLGRVVAVDGNAYFSRPGPRVVDGVELLASILHPEGEAEIPEGAALLRDAPTTP